MHEFNVCQNIVDMVLAEIETMEPKPRKLVKADVVIGGLRQIVPDYLKVAYESLTKGTAAEGSVLEVISTPIVFACRNCQWTGGLAGSPFRCPSCGAAEADIVGGKEMYLKCLEIEEDGP